MCTFLSIIKAVITRIVFSIHGLIAIWQVTMFKKNDYYWYLSCPILLLFFEAIFTLTIKDNQEWKWFCPSVFLYLLSVVPSIWVLELEKIERRTTGSDDIFNLTSTATEHVNELKNMIGIDIKLPNIQINTQTWITIIEQFLMLILIIGRWLLPKGELTKDQLSQLLLVYIGTAADIIEFFDSCNDETVTQHPVLILTTLTIWSWSLMQFTVVLTATKSRKSRLAASSAISSKSNFCGIDVCGIVLNIILQDAPFLVFRLLLITYYRIVSYMNIFFTCKNSLVIVLQFYRIYVIYIESQTKKKKKKSLDSELINVAVISKPHTSRQQKVKPATESSDSSTEEELCVATKEAKHSKPRTSRKDTGYSTESSMDESRRTEVKPKKSKVISSDNKRQYSPTPSKPKSSKQKSHRSSKNTKSSQKVKRSPSTDSDDNAVQENRKKKSKNKGKEKRNKTTSSSSVSSAD